MASKQESVSDWMELARIYDKAEKEQKVVPYMVVVLRNKRTNEILYRYDLPRDMFWKYSWVIDWRAAKLLCQNPRDGIEHRIDFYDKTTGLKYGFGSLISKLTSAKAQITIANNKLQRYIDSQKANMFFSTETDEVVAKLKAKISMQKEKAADFEAQIKLKVQELNK